MACSKDGGNFLFGSGSRKLLFNSSTPTARAGQLHFISKDISLKQITKVQSFAPELLADRQTQGEQHTHQSASGSQLSCMSWGATPTMPGVHEVCRAFAKNRGLIPCVGINGASFNSKSRTRLEPWFPAQPADGNAPPCRSPSCIACEQGLPPVCSHCKSLF